MYEAKEMIHTGRRAAMDYSMKYGDIRKENIVNNLKIFQMYKSYYMKMIFTKRENKNA